MTEHEHFEAQWRSWRHARLSELTHPYGWTSLTAQHWLRAGDPARSLEGLPGMWHVKDHQVWVTPGDRDDPRTVLRIGGEPVTHATPVPQASAPQTARETGASPWSNALFSGERYIEVLPRTATGGASTFAVRIRDPRATATQHTLQLPAFTYDPAFRRDAVFTPLASTDVVRETVVPGILDIVPSVGTLRFSLEGTEHQVVVFERETDGTRTPFTHLHDTTSGSLSHSNGRMLTLAYSDQGGANIDVIDFNFLYSLPCAVTDHVSCPLPIPENRLKVALLAGEKAPILANS